MGRLTKINGYYYHSLICQNCCNSFFNRLKHQKFCCFKCYAEYHQKYSYNRNYFSKINTPQKSYWIGFILGDGHLTRNGIQLVFRLAKKDKIILKNFLDEIGGSYEQVKEYEHYNNMISLCISSKQIVQDLINIGIPHKNKSFTAKPIKLPFQSAFWLGVFDADGSIGVYEITDDRYSNPYKYNALNISLVGTKEICEGFSEFLDCNGKYVYKRGKIYNFSKGCKRLREVIYEKLYEYDIPSMERKKNVFKI